MIRKTMMLGLLAGLLTLGACDWCCETDSAATTDGAALQAGDDGAKCAECLDGCDEGMAASGMAADVAADVAAGEGPAVCPMSGVAASGKCSDVMEDCQGACPECDSSMKCDSSNKCDDAKPDCCDAPQQCEEPCSKDAPAKPAVQD